MQTLTLMHYILAKVLWLYILSNQNFMLKSNIYLLTSINVKHFNFYVYFLGPSHAMAIYLEMFHKYPTR